MQDGSLPMYVRWYDYLEKNTCCRTSFNSLLALQLAVNPLIKSRDTEESNANGPNVASRRSGKRKDRIMFYYVPLMKLNRSGCRRKLVCARNPQMCSRGQVLVSQMSEARMALLSFALTLTSHHGSVQPYVPRRLFNAHNASLKFRKHKYVFK